MTSETNKFRLPFQRRHQFLDTISCDAAAHSQVQNLYLSVIGQFLAHRIIQWHMFQANFFQARATC